MLKLLYVLFQEADYFDQRTKLYEDFDLHKILLCIYNDNFLYQSKQNC